MKCVLCVSQLDDGCGEQALVDLVHGVRTRVMRSGITGYFYCYEQKITHYFEGTANAVDELLQAIQENPLHNILATQQHRPLYQRRFSNWITRYIEHDYLVEIKPEHVLTDHMLFLGNFGEVNAYKPETVWQLVDTLARVVAELSDRVAGISLAD